MFLRIILNRCEPQELFFVELTTKDNKSSKLGRGKNDPIIFIDILLTSANIHVERERDARHCIRERECVCVRTGIVLERERESVCVCVRAGIVLERYRER